LHAATLDPFERSCSRVDNLKNSKVAKNCFAIFAEQSRPQGLMEEVALTFQP